VNVEHGTSNTELRTEDRHRTAEATLKLVGADGRPVASGQAIRIEQEKHAFLFGCNIFKFARCATPRDEEAYRKQYADLFNFATLPFYWWTYEREQGRPMDAHGEQPARSKCG